MSDFSGSVSEGATREEEGTGDDADPFGVEAEDNSREEEGGAGEEEPLRGEEEGPSPRHTLRHTLSLAGLPYVTHRGCKEIPMSGIRAWNPADFKVKTLSVRIKPDLWERLRAVALAEGARTPSNFVRQLVANACTTLHPAVAPKPATGKHRPAKAGRKIHQRGKPPGKKGRRSPSRSRRKKR